jgi:hypothetical protein
MSQTTNVLVTLFILIIIFLLIRSYLENRNQNIEPYTNGFTNRKSHRKQLSPRKVSEDKLLLQDVYPLTDSQAITANSITDVWWQRPVFQVGSYAQITNNLRYRKNPDDGECTTIDFCDSLYKDIKNKNNHLYPLKPVPTHLTNKEKRVNYYSTPYNLFLGQQAVELPVFQ